MRIAKRWTIILVALAFAWVFALSFFQWRPNQDWDNTPDHLPPVRLSESSRRILNSNEKFVLLSLRPYADSTNDLTERFHDYPILGRVEIKDAKLKDELIGAMYQGITESKTGNLPACFNPRHGIRAESGTNWIELVICFECAQIQAFTADSFDGATTTKSPTEIFNRILREAEVPISTQ